LVAQHGNGTITEGGGNLTGGNLTGGNLTASVNYFIDDNTTSKKEMWYSSLTEQHNPILVEFVSLETGPLMKINWDKLPLKGAQW